MSKRLFLTAALATAGALPSPAHAQERWLDVTNNSNTTIMEFRASRSDNSDWGPDLLGANVIAPGQTRRLEPARREQRRGGCEYDVKVVFSGGRNWEQRRIDICSATDVVCTRPGACSVR